jgi:hypothetical protein
MHERESHTMSFVAIHEFPHAHTFLQSRWLCTQPSEIASCLVISGNLMCLLSEKVICMTHFVIHSGCTSMPGLLLVINKCPAVVESIVPFLHPCLWYCVFYVSLQGLGINSHWSNTLLIQTKWDYILRHLKVFLVGLPSLNWLHGDNNVQCLLMAV